MADLKERMKNGIDNVAEKATNATAARPMPLKARSMEGTAWWIASRTTRRI